MAPNDEYYHFLYTHLIYPLKDIVKIWLSPFRRGGYSGKPLSDRDIVGKNGSARRNARRNEYYCHISTGFAIERHGIHLLPFLLSAKVR